MAGPHFAIKVYDVPDAEGCVRSMQREARALASRYPTLTALHFGLARDGAQHEAPQYEAHIDLHFPQHQVIVNATAPSTERAVRDVLLKATGELTRVASRDPSVASTREAVPA